MGKPHFTHVESTTLFSVPQPFVLVSFFITCLLYQEENDKQPTERTIVESCETFSSRCRYLWQSTNRRISRRVGLSRHFIISWRTLESIPLVTGRRLQCYWRPNLVCINWCRQEFSKPVSREKLSIFNNSSDSLCLFVDNDVFLFF